MVDNSDWTEEGMDARLQERTEAKKSKSRERCEKEAMIAEEERKDPNACEMKRIKGLHTSRGGGKKDVWRKKNE